MRGVSSATNKDAHVLLFIQKFWLLSICEQLACTISATKGKTRSCLSLVNEITSELLLLLLLPRVSNYNRPRSRVLRTIKAPACVRTYIHVAQWPQQTPLWAQSRFFFLSIDIILYYNVSAGECIALSIVSIYYYRRRYAERTSFAVCYAAKVRVPHVRCLSLPHVHGRCGW